MAGVYIHPKQEVQRIARASEKFAGDQIGAEALEAGRGFGSAIDAPSVVTPPAG